MMIYDHDNNDYNHNDGVKVMMIITIMISKMGIITVMVIGCDPSR